MPSPLQQKLAELKKKDSSLRIGSIEDLQQFTGQTFSTGNIAMDNALGTGGIPRGKVIELFGPSQSGKTTIALQTAALHQKAVKEGRSEGAILYLDYEASLDKGYVQALGIDTEDKETWIYSQPDHFEQGAQLYRDLMNDELIALAIFDSVAGMVSEKEQKADSGAATFGDRAKALHQFMRQTKGPNVKHGVTPIFLNHMMEKIDTSYVGQQMAARGIKQWTTPGGTALVFWADQRVQFTQPSNADKHEVFNAVLNDTEKLVTSTDVIAKVVKNKLATPQRVAKMRVRFGRGFSQAYSVYQVLVAYKKIKKNGSWITFPSDLAPVPGEAWQVQGEEAVISELEDNSEWLSRMEVAARFLVASEETEQIDIDPNIDPETGEVREEKEA